MKKKYKKSTRPEKSTKKVQNLEIVKKSTVLSKKYDVATLQDQ